MARIVMCWELGGDLGHVARMQPLAEALRARGHTVSFIVREPQSAQRLLDPAHYAWLQAPYQTDPIAAPCNPTRNLAEILHNIGFHDPRVLRARIKAWRNLYALLQPDLLVFDHSPTALLAARGLRTRRLVLGTGFGVPPVAYPLPPFETGDAGPGLKASEDRVTANANSALQALGEPPLGRLADIYSAQSSVLFTLKELDHYPGREGGDYWGPTRQDRGVAPTWPSGRGRVFAYLKPFRTLPELLQAFQDSGRPTLVYLANATAEQRRQHEGAHVRFSEKPVDLGAAVRDADVVVCHAGHGTVSAALLGGKPALMLPLNMEQRMLSIRVVEAGAGLAAPALAPDAMRQKLQRLLEEPAFSEAARRFAERYATLRVEDIPERFAVLVERLLASEAV